MHSLPSYLPAFSLLLFLSLCVPRVRVYTFATYCSLVWIGHRSTPPPPNLTGSFIFIETLLLPINSTPWPSLMEDAAAFNLLYRSFVYDQARIAFSYFLLSPSRNPPPLRPSMVRVLCWYCIASLWLWYVLSSIALALFVFVLAVCRLPCTVYQHPCQRQETSVHYMFTLPVVWISTPALYFFVD